MQVVTELTYVLSLFPVKPFYNINSSSGVIGLNFFIESNETFVSMLYFESLTRHLLFKDLPPICCIFTQKIFLHPMP